MAIESVKQHARDGDQAELTLMVVNGLVEHEGIQGKGERWWCQSDTQERSPARKLRINKRCKKR